MDHQFCPCKLSIPTYRWFDDAQTIALFNIDVNMVGLPQWRVQKRYSDFYDFDTILQSTFSHIPELPGKTITKLKEHKDVDKRRIKLEKYLTQVASRLDIVSCKTFAKFFKFEQYAEKYIFEEPKLEFEISGFNQTVRDFYFSNEENILFVATAETAALNQVDAFFNNKDSQTKTPLGFAELWQFNESKMTKQWYKQFSHQAICLHWERISTNLVIGLDNGGIVVIQLQNLYDTTKQIEYTNHTGRVTAVFLDQKSGLIHSISKDGYYKLTILETLAVRYSNSLKDELLAMQICGHRQISIISSNKGQIFIFDISKAEPKLIINLSIPGKLIIRSLSLDSAKGFLFAACEEGFLQVVELKQRGSEKYSKLSTQLRCNPLTRQVAFGEAKRHLFIGDGNGQIAILSAVQGQAIYQFTAHEFDSYITKLIYIQEQELLLSVAKKSGLKVWSIPKSWPNLSQIKEQEAQEIRKENITQMQKQVKQQNYDSDDDELNDWHKK